MHLLAFLQRMLFEFNLKTIVLKFFSPAAIIMCVWREGERERERERVVCIILITIISRERERDLQFKIYSTCIAPSPQNPNNHFHFFLKRYCECIEINISYIHYDKSHFSFTIFILNTH